MKKNKPIIVGLGGALSLLIIYFGILTISNSLSHALNLFSFMWYWVILLAGGFGIQLGLYTYIRITLRKRMKSATAGVAASGGVSTFSMVACCAHLLTDMLPIIGLAAAAIFLVKYQIAFILLGVFSNLVGITIMLNAMQQHKIHPKSGWGGILFSFKMKTIRNMMIILAIVVVFSSFLRAASSTPKEIKADISESKIYKLKAKVNNEKYVTVKVEPKDFSFDKAVKFQISLNTHSVSLDYDLVKLSILEDDQGNIYKPVRWEGSASGGHHRSGILIFPKLKVPTKQFKLTIKNISGIPERIFEWDLL